MTAKGWGIGNKKETKCEVRRISTLDTCMKMSQQNPLLCTINIFPIKYFHFSFLCALNYKGMTFVFGVFFFFDLNFSLGNL